MEVDCAARSVPRCATEATGETGERLVEPADAVDGALREVDALEGVDHADRGPLHPGVLGGDLGQGVGEHDEDGLTSESGGRGEDSVQARLLRLVGEVLACRPVVGGELSLGDAQPLVASGSVRSSTARSFARARPTRRRTSNGETSSWSQWRNNSAHAPRSVSDAYQTPGPPARW